MTRSLASCEDEPVDELARQELGVARVEHGDLAHHLTRDDLDVLVVDVDALAARRPPGPRRRCRTSTSFGPRRCEQVVRVDRAFGQLRARRRPRRRRRRRDADGRDARPCSSSRGPSVAWTRQLAGLVAVLDGERAGDLRELRLALGLAGLEQLGDTRETVGDVLAGDAAGVEGTHRELGARLADRLRGDDADRRADVDRAADWRGPSRSTSGRCRASRGRS